MNQSILAAALLWQMAGKDSLSDEQFDLFHSAALATERQISKQIENFIKEAA